QRLDLHFVEAAARDDQSRSRKVVGRRPRIQARDDTIDVGLDVDAGPLLELALAVLATRKRLVQLLAKLRGHDVLHVHVRDDRGVARKEPQFVGTLASGKSAGWKPDVIRNQSGPDSDTQHQKGSD